MVKNEQVLDLKRDEPICIETAEGMIELTFLSGSSGKKIKIVSPGDMEAHRGRERALRAMRFFRAEGARLVPTFQLLAPVIDEHGELVKLAEPRSFAVGV